MLTNWTDKVKTGMHASIEDVSAIQTVFVLQILLILSVNVTDDRFNRILVVQCFAIVQRIHYGQLQLNASLLDVGILFDNLNFLVQALLERRLFAIANRLVQFGEEERINQGGFAETRFADHQQGELESFLGRFSWFRRRGSERINKMTIWSLATHSMHLLCIWLGMFTKPR